MYAGEIMELATTDELFARPRHPYTIGLIGSIPRAQRSQPLMPIPGTPPDLIGLAPGCPFAPRCAWVSDECRSGEIPFMQVGPDHWSRCIRADHLDDPRASGAGIEPGNAGTAPPGA
jgi:oligopeptide/dipeptide ABC transporter ATP-binding protein